MAKPTAAGPQHPQAMGFVDDDASPDDDAAYAHDLSTCCQAETCPAFSTTYPTTPAGYVANDTSATTVAGVVPLFFVLLVVKPAPEACMSS